MQRILGIGLNKTGTTSLHVAMHRLGHSSLHRNSVRNNTLVQRARDERHPLLKHLPQRDAYFDLFALRWSFDALDKQYPGSKFINSVRDLDSWLESRRRHVHRNRQAKARGTYEGKWLKIDIPKWRDRWHAHQELVDNYFANRKDDLLTINVCAGEGYEKLCPFLGKPILNEPFPWKNRAPLTNAAVS